MLKKFYKILILFFLFLPGVFAEIIVNPSSLSLTMNPGGVSVNTFTFAQLTSNTSTSIALTKTGTNSDFVSFNISTGSVSKENDTQINLSLKVTTTVPASSSLGTSLIKIKYDSSEIPLVLTIVENDTTTTSIGKCRLEPFPDSYTIPFIVGSPPVIQTFSVLVSKHCTEEINIKTPVIIGNTQTKDGLRPLNLIGGSKLGFIDPNNEGNFDIQIDATNLPSGTYKPQILITGIYKGEQLNTKILFTVEIRQGATPLESTSVLPTYLFSASDLSLNNTYTITAQNLNPNFLPFVEQNEFIRGVKVDTSSGWIYHFQPVKVGNTKLRVGTYFAGAPIGDITEKEIRITFGSAVGIGTRMCFQFFTPGNKPLDGLTPGDAITVLVRSTNNNDVLCSANDTQSAIINAVDLYKSGVKLSTNSFTVNAGEITTLSASAPGFITIDKVIDVPLNPVQVFFKTQNNELEVNVPLSITTDPSDAVVTINGNIVSDLNNFTFTEEGKASITATKSGFKQKSFDVDVTPELKILTTEIPKKININEPYLVELNKPAKWSVSYRENKKNATIFVFKEGFLKTIEFTPDRNGIYKVNLRDNELRSYKIGGIFGLTIPSWFWWGVGVIITIFIAYKIFSGRRGKSMASSSKYEFDVDELTE